MAGLEIRKKIIVIAAVVATLSWPISFIFGTWTGSSTTIQGGLDLLGAYFLTLFAVMLVNALAGLCLIGCALGAWKQLGRSYRLMIILPPLPFIIFLVGVMITWAMG